MQQTKVVDMRGITKRFPGITVNDGIDLSLLQGEVHAILGENGAGKSTLMNILFGLYQPDEGEIRIHGKPALIDNPNTAIRLGIGMVHQHFKLVQPFTVAENIILGSEPRRGFSISYREAVRRVEDLSRQYGLNVDPNARIEEISVGMQQRVEILKTLYRGADILVFDEPTAVLTPDEIEELLDIMRSLVRQGKSILLITHKLKEIMEIADRVTVIRRGKVIGNVAKAETNPSQLAEMMVGRSVSMAIDKKPIEPGKPVLQVERLVVKGRQGAPAVNGISFTVREGEVVGIAGVDGNGQSELIQALTGLRKAESGEVRLMGADITNAAPRAISETGMGHIPEDRHKHGLVLDFSLRENMALRTYDKKPFKRYGLLDYAAIDKHAQELVEQFDVRCPDIYTQARALSGGNQQKAIIAREIEKGPELLIAAQPTRGLDVGAIEYIHRRIVEQRNKGKGVLLVSYELDEILSLSDRVLIIFDGQIIGETRPEETNDRELGLRMAGSRLDKDAERSHAG